jgi:hypothetical protein
VSLLSQSPLHCRSSNPPSPSTTRAGSHDHPPHSLLDLTKTSLAVIPVIGLLMAVQTSTKGHVHGSVMYTSARRQEMLKIIFSPLYRGGGGLVTSYFVCKTSLTIRHSLSRKLYGGRITCVQQDLPCLLSLR